MAKIICANWRAGFHKSRADDTQITILTVDPAAPQQTQDFLIVNCNQPQEGNREKKTYSSLVNSPAGVNVSAETLSGFPVKLIASEGERQTHTQNEGVEGSRGGQGTTKETNKCNDKNLLKFESCGVF